MPATMLSSYAVLRSNDPEQIRDRLFTVFGADRFELSRRTRQLAVRADHLRLSSVSLSYLELDGGISISFPEASFVRQAFNIEGQASLDVSRVAEEIAPGGWSSVIPADTPTRLDFHNFYRHLALRIEREALHRHLGLLLGESPGREPEFYTRTNHGNPAMADLRRQIFLFAHDFNTRGRSYSPLVATEFERMLITTFLISHQHTFSAYLVREPTLPSMSEVARAEEYMMANWDKPLDMSTLAAVTQVSARSLFRQFRRLRNYTPSEFAKRIRLQRALEMLQHPDESTSVTQVLDKCGFHNTGHFAHDYYQAFGELPSDTLKRSTG